MKRAAIVYNPVKVNEAKLRLAVAADEAEYGWAESLWLETSVEDPGGGRAQEALDAGVDVVVAAGGDGTVRAVAERLRGTEVALSLLPSGTGNLLARNLDLTLNHLEDSVRTAFTGDDHAIDIGSVRIERANGERETHRFLVMAGLGLDAQMVANTNPELKRRFGWLAYVDAIARSLRGNNRLRARYRLDGGTTRAMTAHTILVGNCGSLPGNILLLPDAAVDDGLFDIVSLRPDGFIGWVQIWFKIFWENGVLRRSQVGRKLMGFTKEVRTLRYLKGAELIVRLDKPEEFELDGDSFGTIVAFRANVEHGELLVRLPAKVELASEKDADD